MKYPVLSDVVIQALPKVLFLKVGGKKLHANTALF